MIILPSKPVTKSEAKQGCFQAALIITAIAVGLMVLNLPVAAAFMGILSALYWLIWLLMKFFWQ